MGWDFSDHEREWLFGGLEMRMMPAYSTIQPQLEDWTFILGKLKPRQTDLFPLIYNE